MPTIATKDGTSLFCLRWADGPPVLLVHGWATNSELWQPLMARLTQAGLQAIAFDRRGHGRSDDPGRGYDYDTLADDLASVIEGLDLDCLTLVGHSMGCGEIARYLTRHGAARVRRVVMVAPALPYALKTPDNPQGASDPAQHATWRDLWTDNFSDWIGPAVTGAFGPDGPPERVRQTIRSMLSCSLQAAIELNATLTRTDFRPELRTVATPTLVLHGDTDQSCPLEATGGRLPALMPDCRLEVYPGAGHGLLLTESRQIATDILAFMGESARVRAA